MPALEQAAVESPERPRIVTVASIAHNRGLINFDDLQSTKSYGPMRAYQQSKLSRFDVRLELDRRLRAARSRVMSVAAHPGVARTKILQAGDDSSLEKAVRNLMGHAIGILLNTDAEGALPTLYAATAPDVGDGSYYYAQGFPGDARRRSWAGMKVAPQALDMAASPRSGCGRSRGRSHGCQFFTIVRSDLLASR